MTPAQKKRLKEIEDEWVENAYERIGQPTTEDGQKRWDELWARGKELEKLRAKLLKEAGEDVQPITTAVSPVAA